MSHPSPEYIIQTLEQSWALMEGGHGIREQHKQAIMGCLALLLDHQPDKVLEAARGSFLPTRALVSWMVFEAERMPEPGPARARALRELWQREEETGAGSILPPPADPALLSH